MQQPQHCSGGARFPDILAQLCCPRLAKKLVPSHCWLMTPKVVPLIRLQNDPDRLGDLSLCRLCKNEVMELLRVLMLTAWPSGQTPGLEGSL